METTYDAAILAAGDYPTHPTALKVLNYTPHIICCDGAAHTLIAHGHMPCAIVGDGDSLPHDIKVNYPHLVHTETEQEYNDLTKSTRYVLNHIPLTHRRIAYLGCTGQREDHTLGNISLMAYYRREFHIQPTMLTNHGTFTPAFGTRTFPSFPRQQVSIFRIHCHALSSEGLRWNSYPYTEWWQGTLNEALTDSFTIHSDGEYIVFQTYSPK